MKYYLWFMVGGCIALAAILAVCMCRLAKKSDQDDEEYVVEHAEQQRAITTIMSNNIEKGEIR